MGPNNFLARSYQQMPIAITVEGANILTRSLIIFGQGALRCHPYVLKEMQACGEKDAHQALHDFDAAFFGHAALLLSNLGRTVVYGLSGGIAAPVAVRWPEEIAVYSGAVSRLSAIFALTSDAVMLVLGSGLKRSESISGRMGDVLSQMLLISACLKRYDDEGMRQEDMPYVHWAVQDALWQAQQALLDVYRNLPLRPLAWLLRLLAFPLGLPWSKPADALSVEVAKAMQSPDASRERLLADAYLPPAGVDDPLAYAEAALRQQPQIRMMEQRIKPLVKSGNLTALPQSFAAVKAWAAQASNFGMITGEEQAALVEYAYYGERMIRVDDFPQDLSRCQSRGPMNEKAGPAPGQVSQNVFKSGVPAGKEGASLAAGS
jgi:acyl-CoA dehydrogenase